MKALQIILHYSTHEIYGKIFKGASISRSAKVFLPPKTTKQQLIDALQLKAIGILTDYTTKSIEKVVLSPEEPDYSPGASQFLLANTFFRNIAINSDELEQKAAYSIIPKQSRGLHTPKEFREAIESLGGRVLE